MFAQFGADGQKSFANFLSASVDPATPVSTGWSWNRSYSITQTWLMVRREHARHRTQPAGTTTSFEITTFRLLLFPLLLTLLTITCMQGIYNYIPETNHISRAHTIAAVLYLQFALHVMPFRPWNMLCTFTSALSAVRVHCSIWLLFVVP
jgi:hypothetical protein